MRLVLVLAFILFLVFRVAMISLNDYLDTVYSFCNQYL